MSVTAKQGEVVHRGHPSAKGAFQLWVDGYGRAWRRGMPTGGSGDGAAGMLRLARELGCAPMTVQHWYYRRGLPKSTWLHQILQIANGALTFADIVESTRKPEDFTPTKKKKKIN